MDFLVTQGCAEKTQSYAEFNSVTLCGSPDFLCVSSSKHRETDSVQLCGSPGFLCVSSSKKTCKIPIYVLVITLLLFSGCNSRHETVNVDSFPEIFPDYIGVTVPCNIAPLNFRIEGECRKAFIEIAGKRSGISIKSNGKAIIPARKWKKLLEEEKGDSLSVRVTALIKGEWKNFSPFSIHVSADRIDPYVTYRLIEPGYEVWNRLQLAERNLENFSERIIADNNMLDRGCINCHIFSAQDPSASFFHLRHRDGGTMVQKNGVFRKLNTSSDSTISAGVYGGWHPGGRFIAYSTNVIIPEFHSKNNLRIEVYDTISDVIIADLEKNLIIENRALTRGTSLETFPVFSSDGSKLYFCSAEAVKMPENYRSVRYSLCSVGFNPAEGSVSLPVDTLISAFRTRKTLSHPKPSPDGKYILYTSFDYGNFPVWHREADLHLLNLSDMSIDTLPTVNSSNADSYHSWSSESRWFVFASKRENGMFGMLYFAHIDEQGNVSAPFLLPQKDPDHYDFFMKSYNIPELAKGSVPFSASDAEKAFRQLDAERMKFEVK